MEIPSWLTPYILLSWFMFVICWCLGGEDAFCQWLRNRKK